jgi:hypothetical protein
MAFLVMLTFTVSYKRGYLAGEQARNMNPFRAISNLILLYRFPYPIKINMSEDEYKIFYEFVNENIKNWQKTIHADFEKRYRIVDNPATLPTLEPHVIGYLRFKYQTDQVLIKLRLGL